MVFLFFFCPPLFNLLILASNAVTSTSIRQELGILVFRVNCITFWGICDFWVFMDFKDVMYIWILLDIHHRLYEIWYELTLKLLIRNIATSGLNGLNRWMDGLDSGLDTTKTTPITKLASQLENKSATFLQI